MAVGLEELRVLLNGSGDLPAAGETEFAVEFTGIVELENVFGLIGEILF